METPIPPNGTSTESRLTDAERPGADGERLTVPTNPFRLLRVIVDVSEDPGVSVNVSGAASMLKSGSGIAQTAAAGRMRPGTATRIIKGISPMRMTAFLLEENIDV